MRYAQSGSAQTTPLANNRGAVFLLAIYVTALFLLILSGVSLQRSSHEQRMSQINRDGQQAFWLAEAGLDSAVAGLQQQGLLPTIGEELLLPTTLGTVTLDSLVPLSAQVRSIDDQELTATLISQGRTSTGAVRRVGTTFNQQGPLGGIWSEGAIVIHGGKEYQEIFLSGNVYSGRGSVVSTIPPKGYQDASGHTYDGKTWRFQGYSTAADRTDLYEGVWSEETPAEISSVMRSLAAGYRTQQLAPYTRDETVYNVETGGGGNQHVAGVLAVGINDDVVQGVERANCSATMLLPPGETVVVDEVAADGDYGQFRYENPVRRGAHDANDVIDRDAHRGHMLLCVNAIAPTTDSGLGQAIYANDPPKLIFRQPTTIVVTGNELYNLTDQSFPVDIGGTFMDLSFNTVNAVVGFVAGQAMQAQWRVTLAAEISAIDANGDPIPEGVEILQRKAERIDRDFSTQGGLIMLKPGAHFDGSVYAPNSTVWVRYRSEDHRDGTLKLQTIVGKEVIVQMESDHLSVGPKEGDDALEEIETEFLKWTANP